MSVLLAVPTIDKKIHAACMLSIIKLKEILNINNIQLNIIIESGSLIGRVRNDIFYKFINSNNDYLLSIDSDISGFENSIISLIKQNNKNNQYLGITYVKKQDELKLNVNILKNINESLEEIKENQGFLKVKHLPTGCSLLPKQTALNLVEKFKRRAYNDYLSEEIKYNLYDSFIFNNRLLSEDYGFSELIRQLEKSEIICDCVTELKHHGDKIYKGSLVEYFLINNI